MMPLEWNDNLCVGHPTIDAQHQEIFKRFGELLEACNQGRAAESLQELFDFLDDYVKQHFGAEEELMERYDYDQHDEHLAEHREFEQRLEELKQEMNSSGITPLVLIRTNKALIYWLTHHIRNVDSSLGDFLEKRV